eukprot:CAMPEP_0113617458 /NCGR_PEP_ID=MMETSP0017_2-20120614/8792_1 /TAXON_ID=2856 /ORGANISM="Cylindrotheca closterium" /LENGTH=140 /DNA_ID=CAMNT_0000526857 /DNA_START=42 /DNA_END=460 /DNA_ORIENTATION=+ /assembly_acc=CAM_ASM_000147
MKFATAILVSLPFVAPFAPVLRSSPKQARSCSALSAIVTGPEGKAAASREEDIALTLKLIMDHDERSTTVSKDQFIQQMEESVKIQEQPEEVVDVSVPYDAAAKLAYDASDKSMAYEDFEKQYLMEAVALVKSKQAGTDA